MPLPLQFRSIFQFMPAPSVVLLPDPPKFTILAVNNAYLEVVNSTEKDLIGKGIFEAFPENPEDRISNGVENLTNSLNLVIANKEVNNIPLQKYDIPIRGTTKFKVSYASIQNIPIKDDDNNVTHILHSIEDVTDKKQLELLLEIERQRFNDLYSQAPSCMGILKGSDHVYILANPLYLELIGEKEVIGKTVKEVLPELEAQGILEILDNVYETGETFSANERLVKFDHHNNGELVDRFLNFIYQANKNNEGIIDGILFFATDVTELVLARKKIEESEKRYKELIQNLPVATYICDLEGRILLYNKAAAKLWRREPQLDKDKWGGAFKIYSETGDILPVEKYPIVIALKEGRKVIDQEIILEQLNGDRLNVLPHVVPYRNSSGQVIGAVNVVIDITGQKKASEILQKLNKELANHNQQMEIRTKELIISNKQLVKTNKELDRFVYSVSHDLRSPLTSILGLISFIEEESKEPDTLEQVKMIRTSVNRLDGFIKNILSYSQNNRTNLETQEIPVKETLLQIVASLQNINEARGISIHIDILEPYPFYSDWHRFNTVFENLIANAIKHHHKEVPGRYLKLTGTSNQDELNLSITDNGIGIAPEFHDKIFEMFYRLPGTTEGSGFGLYIVKETLEKINGSINVQSEKGVGTTFNIKMQNLRA